VREYELEGCRLEVGVPVEVGRAQGHFWFSKLHRIGGQDVLCEVIITDDKAQGQWPTILHLSSDGGANWAKALDIESYGPSSIPLGPRKLLLMPYELWPTSPGDKRNAGANGTVVTLGRDGAIAVTRAPVKFLAAPRDLQDYHKAELSLFTSGNMLPLRDGRLFTTLYGGFAGDERGTCFSFASDDGGFTWHYHSIVASWKDVPDAVAGPSESNTVRLSDGRLMCVYRVDSGQRYHKSYSADDGTAWSRPETVENAWSVEPQLARLDNGTLLLSGGRQGLFVWACTDGKGARWERLNLAEHHNAMLPDPSLHYSDSFCQAREVDPAQSTAYTGMIIMGHDEALICYDRLGNGWAGAPGPWGSEDAVFCVRLRATLKTGRV